MERDENGLNVLINSIRNNTAAEGGTQLNCRGERQLAMVYAPINCFRMLYPMEEALKRGTMFIELDKPLEVLE